LGQYPNQYWFLLIGGFVSAMGSSMVWPFLTIYLSRRLNVPFATIGSLLTLNAAMGVASSFIGGAFSDQAGRKKIMIASLLFGAVYFSMLSREGSLVYYGALIMLWGGFNMLYSIGANAMVADLVPMHQRIDAYAYLRIAYNSGIAIGPVIGGILIGISYDIAFISASIVFLCFGILGLFFLKETLPAPAQKMDQMAGENDKGYSAVLADKVFMSFVVSLSGTFMAGAVMFIMLPVYANQQFGLPESSYGWIITTNALLCVVGQYPVARLIRKVSPLPALAVGALFYALGVGSVSLGAGFWAFLASMVILTLGELIVTPTATTLTAAMSPASMRGRYMSVYGLVWPIGSGIGPVFAGVLYDQIAPVAMWYGVMFTGLLSVLGILILWAKTKKSGYKIVSI
jgi:MFS family permease